MCIRQNQAIYRLKHKYFHFVQFLLDGNSVLFTANASTLPSPPPPPLSQILGNENLVEGRGLVTRTSNLSTVLCTTTTKWSCERGGGACMRGWGWAVLALHYTLHPPTPPPKVVKVKNHFPKGGDGYQGGGGRRGEH